MDKWKRERFRDSTWREVLELIVEMLEVVMTEQDQLKGQLDNIETGIGGVSARINDLLAQIAAGNTNPSLQPLIDEAASEASQLQGLAQSQPTPAPTPGPAPAATPGTTPATATPAPAEQLASGEEDVTVTPSTGVRTPTVGS